LDVAALKKYKREYKLKTRHNSTKAELVIAVTKHFTTIPVASEAEIIEAFIETVNNQGEYFSYFMLTALQLILRRQITSSTVQ
jgi:hypothetical protein